MTEVQPGSENQPAKNVHPGATIRLSESNDRFELWDNGEFIGFLGFSVNPSTDENGREVLHLQHTIISEKYGRQGYARALVTMVLDQLRKDHVQVISSCSYIDRYLQRYPEYQDMVVD
ncbi:MULTISPECIES: GNAT family N-acetyltransferase [Auritidibacter]|uniref:GNAT family N-acetyltransferase n=1 Tax=Auritidibacter ignavus TaxID=678932 RepID=A0AAJ6AGX3_9MICC|nr:MULTISPECIES: GNAT family N-acetyltransferase [Auritidibacter]PXA77551.1 GNAT family N-acetyltransferase [Auritidibacter sp. NML120779]AXR72980.1 N-acetyltransferase [Auritidibacter sp. NML130574]NIH71395.1 hypothetical protein [Auritidibacter ignavus]PXA80971.1 GNAT family N-acetyltransferase [Auritidibacter sp. NML120636]RMX22461.1 N-acetyltransferase [Auritidibacter ignavus]